jgi:Mrp family chromosome partitioning ATPase
MEEIIEELILDFDLVIFDMPPVATVTDAQILAAKTDGTLLVVRERKTKKQELLKAKELLQIAKANILGVVYNGTKKESDLTYYYQSFE